MNKLLLVYIRKAFLFPIHFYHCSLQEKYTLRITVCMFNCYTMILFAMQGTFRVYPLPEDPNAPLPPRVIRSHPPNDPTECLIRVYIIRVSSTENNYFII